MPLIIQVILLGLFFFFKFTDKKDKKQNTNNNNYVNQNMNTNINNNYINQNVNTMNNNYVNQNMNTNINNNYVNQNMNTNNNNNYVNQNINVSNKTIKQEKKDSNTALNVGVILIILSSIIFATTTWNVVSSYIKVLLLLFESLLFLVIGILLKKKFNIIKSGDGLTFISNILFGITFLSCGYFKVFGNEFSLFGKYSNLFIGITFIVEIISLLIRNKLKKEKDYCLILIFSLLSAFYIILQVTDNITISFSLISLILMFLNIYRNTFFGEKIIYFKIINIVGISLLSLQYTISCIFMLYDKENVILIISLIMELIFLIFNVFVTLKNSKEISFLSIIYEGLLILFFCIFSGNLLLSSVTLFIASLGLYLVYYFSNNSSVKVTSIIYFYIQSLISVIMMCFIKESSLFAIISSFILSIITFLAIIKEKGVIKIINYIMQLIFTILFSFLIMNEFGLLSSLKIGTIIFIINLIILFYYILNCFIKSKAKKIYLIVLMICLAIQNFIGLNTISILIITLLINLLLYLYNYFSKDEFDKKILFYISILFVFNCIFGFKNYEILQIILTLSSIIIFYLINNNKKSIIFLSLLYIPIIMFFNLDFITLNSDVEIDLLCILSLPFLLNITRNLINDDEIYVLEFIIYSVCFLNISSNIIIIIYLILIITVAYILNKKSFHNSKYYFNYLTILIPVLCFTLDNTTLYKFSLVTLLCMHAITQVLHLIIYDSRHKIYEIIHSLLSLIIIILTFSKLEFIPIVLIICSSFVIILLGFVYTNKEVKYLNLCYLMYPLITLISNYFQGNIKSILMTFSFIFPIIIFVRKIFNLNTKDIKTIEIISLSFMFFINIFVIDISIAILLGTISIILIIIGYLLRYKELTYLGYISLILLVIIQTVYLWSKLPWWVFLLLFGIILVIIAIYNENKKK